MTSGLVEAIEAGGTKFRCAVAAGTGEILKEVRIATTTPAQTIAACLEFFDRQACLGEPDAFGIASFGPLDLDARSKSRGHLLATPKRGWEGTDLLCPFIERYAKPVAIDTDVNAAALAEAQLGAGRGCVCVAYVTVGTGIGGGAVVNGIPLKGLPHPEMGHLRVVRDPRDAFDGVCPFHGDCLEGLASGPAIRARWGAPLDELPAAHSAVSIIGNYLGQLAAAIVLILASDRIVFGGGVMREPRLIAQIRHHARTVLCGYPTDSVEGRISTPGLGDDSGLLGAVLLAVSAANRPAPLS
ncbi:MAG TPA: ROK family protein [Steroidobacteraceae bacterium]